MGTFRKTPIHIEPKVHLNRSTIVFLTVCTYARRRILANDTAVTFILRAWQAAHSWKVGRFVIMPDHIHLFCAPTDDTFSLKQWVKYWKSLSSKESSSPIGSIWQKNYWDTQLRVGESYEQKWRYVLDNPVRAGLVGDASKWKYAGAEPSTLFRKYSFCYFISIFCPARAPH